MSKCVKCGLPFGPGAPNQYWTDRPGRGTGPLHWRCYKEMVNLQFTAEEMLEMEAAARRQDEYAAWLTEGAHRKASHDYESVDGPEPGEL